MPRFYKTVGDLKLLDPKVRAKQRKSECARNVVATLAAFLLLLILYKILW